MAKVGVPSFVVTLAGLLIFQGVILQLLEVRGTILIEPTGSTTPRLLLL